MPRPLYWYAVIGILYAVGFAGHLYPPTRPLMLFLAPIFLSLVSLSAIALSFPQAKRPVFLGWLAFVFVFSFAVEAAGVATGRIFGQYRYGNVLGPMLFDVPLLIGLLWAAVTFGGLSLFSRFVRSPLLLAVLTGLFCTLYDFAIEPLAVRLGYWTWKAGAVPVQNYAAWFVTATIAALPFALLKLKPSRLSAGGLSVAQIVWLVAVNAAMGWLG